MYLCVFLRLFVIVSGLFMVAKMTPGPVPRGPDHQCIIWKSWHDGSILILSVSCVCALTGVEDSSEHPALGVADGDSGAGVLQQDLNAARPRCRGLSHRVVVTPVPNTHAVIVLRVNLREEGGQRSVTRWDWNVLYRKRQLYYYWGKEYNVCLKVAPK